MGQPAFVRVGSRVSRRKVAAAWRVNAGRMAATPYELAASQAVICHTGPTPLSLPM
jgi:hypothetical protein